jgi:hypothetical protein
MIKKPNKVNNMNNSINLQNAGGSKQTSWDIKKNSWGFQQASLINGQIIQAKYEWGYTGFNPKRPNRHRTFYVVPKE